MKFNSLLKKSNTLLLAGIFAACISVSAQNPSLKVFEDWRTEAGTQNTFFRAGTVSVPGTTNSVVYGATLNANGDYDMLVQKLNSTGAVLWSYQYNGPGNGDDVAADVYYDASTDYAYIAGSYFENSSDSLNAILIALDPTGVLDWSVTHNGTGSGADGFSDVELDAGAGELYCTGTEWAGLSTMYDVLIQKYDITGSLIWSNSFDFMSMIDGGTQLVLSAKPGVMCIGQNGPTSFRYGLVKFNPSSGGVLGAAMGGGTAMGYDRAADVAVDDTGNVYLVGSVYNSSTWSDIRVTKYDTLLNIVWEYDVDAGYNLDDYASGIALDGYNNVIITGTSRTVFNGLNYTVIKYTNSGNIVFYDSYDGVALGNDSAAAVVINPNDTNAIYVTGYSFNGSTNDYRTIRYDGAGNHLWEISMNSILNGDDKATAIALDTLGNVIVTGQTKVADTVYGYTTVRYVEKEVLMPDDTIPVTSNSFVFIENRGQIMGSDSLTHPEIKFYVDRGLPKMYFMDTAVAYVFAKIDTVLYQNDSLTRVDMKFVNANNDLRIRSMDIKSGYSNYFLDHIPEGRSHVQQYGQLASFNVWNNVDVIYGSNAKGLKYYFIGKPGGGGNPMSQIDLEYVGADSVKIGAGGELIIYTKLGNIIQPKAAAWQLDSNGDYQPLGWQPSYVKLSATEVGFTSFGSYNTALPIVFAIDWGNTQPQNIANLSWSTFYGGGLIDQFNDVRTSASGEIFTCGSTTSSSFPVWYALFNVPQGQRDATVVMFNSDGTREWSTYWGGTALDDARGIDISPINGNIFFVGETRSSGFPTYAWGSAESNPPGNASNPEQFIVQLSHDGQTPIWSTCYGGSSRDCANDIKISKAFATMGDIYVVGFTLGTFPTYSPPSWAAGRGTILKFNSLGVLQMATNFGSADGQLEDVAIDRNGDVVIVGWFDSGTGVPIQNAGGNSTYGGGTYDGVICKFSGINSTIWWSTYYGGDGHDFPRSIEVAPAGGPYIFYYVVGETKSDNGLPVVNPGWGYYQGTNSNSGYADAFVVQINEWGGFMWSTYYGGSGDDRGWAITVDPDLNIYIMGDTKSNDLTFPWTNLSNTYVSNTLNGYNDGFLACFQSLTYLPLWVTYFGGAMQDYIYSAACYSSTHLYMVGWTECQPDFPLSDGGGIPYYDDTDFGGKGFITQFDLTPVALVGTQEQENTKSITVFPNPADASVHIYAPNSEFSVTITDVYGRIIFTQQYQTNYATVSVADFSAGPYIVSVNCDNVMYNQKLTVYH